MSKTSFFVCLVLLSGFAVGSGRAERLKLPPTEPLEKYDNPPAPLPLWNVGTSPGMVSQFGTFTSYQVNVDASGQNIIGDAANECTISVDPTDRNKMTVAWRQFNSVTSNFRQGGWGYTTNGGTSWTFPGVLENNVFRSDPVTNSDETGRFFYLSLQSDVNQSFFCDDLWRSTNGGTSWTLLSGERGGGGGDKQWFTIDKTAGPGHGFQYQSDDGINCSGGGVQFQRSINGGATWQSPITIPNGPVYGTLDVDTNGNLFIGGEGNTFYCVRSSNAQIGGQTPTFDRNTAVNMGGDLGSGGINPAGLDGMCFLAIDRSGGATNNNVYMLASVVPPGRSTTDVMFVRSTDGGLTFSAPHKINDDPVNPNKWHWFGTFAVAPNGRLDAVWYDTRNAANNTDSQLFYSFSSDGGITWAPNIAVSNSFNPSEGYPNQNKIGDYITIVSDNNGGNVAYAATFNFNPSRGQHEEDVYYVRLPQGFCVTSTVPCSGCVVSTQPTDFLVNLTDPVDPATVDATDFTVNGTPANSFVLGGSNTQITFHFNSTPVVTQGLQTMHIAVGAFTSGGNPVCEFTGTFRYDATLLQVTTTVPVVGGVFSPPAPGSYQYDVNWNEAVDPTSVSMTDLTLSGSGGNVTGVSVINANMTTRFTLNLPFGGALTANIAAGAITDAFGNPNAAFAGNYTVQGCPPQDHYTIAQIGGSIVPGTTDIGNHGDDQVTTVALPFTYSLYGQAFTSVNLSSNGNAQFVTTDTAFTNQCLPWLTHNDTIFPYWDDLYLVNAGFGIFTSVSGTAPNRIFNIEWRAQYFPGSGTANFELRLYEGQSRFDVIYSTVTNGNTSATAGVQKNDTAFDQYFCNGSGNVAASAQSYILQSCANPLTANSAVSRQNHGAPGNFDINLPLSGGPGIECRNGAGSYLVIITFSNNVVSGNASVTSGTGVAGAPSFSANTMSIPLSGVTDVQQITVTATNVTDVNAQVLPSVPVPMIMLIGDSAGTGNGTVNAGDIGFVKSKSGQTTGAGNFRADIAINGTINASDVGLVKSKSGNHVP